MHAHACTHTHTHTHIRIRLTSTVFAFHLHRMFGVDSGVCNTIVLLARDHAKLRGC
jgi:hypothetical protein